MDKIREVRSLLVKIMDYFYEEDMSEEPCRKAVEELITSADKLLIKVQKELNYG